MECLLPYLCMVTVPHIMVGLERILDYRGVGLARFNCIYYCILFVSCVHVLCYKVHHVVLLKVCCTVRAHTMLAESHISTYIAYSGNLYTCTYL